MSLMLARSIEPGRTPFGRNLKDHDLFLAQLAGLRMEVEYARLLVLNAADMIDRVGAKGALRNIAMAKVQTGFLCRAHVRLSCRRSPDGCLTGLFRYLGPKASVRIN